MNQTSYHSIYPKVYIPFLMFDLFWLQKRRKSLPFGIWSSLFARNPIVPHFQLPFPEQISLSHSWRNSQIPLSLDCLCKSLQQKSTCLRITLLPYNLGYNLRYESFNLYLDMKQSVSSVHWEILGTRRAGYLKNCKSSTNTGKAGLSQTSPSKN